MDRQNGRIPMVGVQIRILGPVSMFYRNGAVPLAGQRQLRVIAALALVSGRAVSTPELIGHLWGENPPRTAPGQLQTSVWMIRRSLAAAGVPQETVLSTASGYQLDPAHCEIDSDIFRCNVAASKKLVRAGHKEEALERVKDALSLWRGPALATISSSALQTRAARLEEERVAALQQRICLEITLGEYEEAIGELTDLIVLHPLREELYAHLMQALYLSGRQADALAVFRRARNTLTDELGIDPGPRLTTLERAILRQDADMLAAVPGMARR
ncbi:AfsR/SARP family transcriptional regulator [Streptomyces sp. NBC_00111]|uniref:AfsR/SARP family transcriptional regulator n=1 Tax=unclassified Streptomyces TaxID=2593676 RepID=UPI002E2FF761|nr:AfsR/SARP family transcriptional regulator [Streptomyces sp. NBC_01460]